MIEDEDREAVEEFGPYLVYERLGVGGMATVHRALERGIEGFERIVALKRLLPHLAEDASFIKSFVREAKLASTLQHANIVQTLELGRVGSTYFISMEYIDGLDIRKLLRHARKVSGPPPINVTIGLMLQLCEALDYAHNRRDADDQPLGLVHRDLSPSNLLLTRQGHLKVIDFGIAKAQSAQLRTQTGRVKGKLAYMAPESMAGKELDSRSDLFSAGVVFHELLTARPLFAQKNEYQTLLKVQRAEVSPPSAFNEGVPEEIDDIVLKALARDPDDRWSTAGALRDALITVRMARQLSATPRDVATWCDWAFALEPGGFSGRTFTEGLPAFGGSASPISLPPPTPKPTKSQGDDEVAAELAWGGPEEESGVVHLLDDVPDVSSKLPVAAIAAAADFALGGATDQHYALAPALIHSAPTQLGITVSSGATIMALAVPPPARSRELRPAAFTAPPGGPAGGSTFRGHARGSQPPPFPTTNLLDLHGPTLAAPSHLTWQPASALETPNIGASIAARKLYGARNAIVALVALGAAATAVTLAVTVGDDEIERVATVTPPTGQAIDAGSGTVKFAIEPADAVIKLGDGEAHAGSPWQTRVPVGVHQVEIHRDGYKSWLTSVELSNGETQTLRVVLEPVRDASVNTATLIVDPSIRGLEVALDGERLDRRTPVRIEIKPGPHRVVILQDGAEAWAHEFTATANATHAFDPSMSDDKQIERRRRRERATIASAPLPVSSDAVATPTRAPDPAPVTTTSSGPSLPPALPAPITLTPAPTQPVTAPPPAAPAITTPAPVAVPPPAPPTLAPAARPPPTPAAAKPSGPVVIPPSAVSRTSGSVPSLSTRGGDALPAAISAKVCIDHGGAVTSAKVLSKIADDLKRKLETAIHTWRYSPYKHSGTAVAACFVASFRSK
jgi:serine/threonine protein kinase